jgi:DNA repair protein RecO (recombination protein O)
MEFKDRAFVLAARAHGEAGAIVELLTADHGKWAAHVAGGASRKLAPVLQAGNLVQLAYRSRLSDQLGSARLEPLGEGASLHFDDPTALAALGAAAAVVAAAVPEREPHPGVFLALETLISLLDRPGIWPPVFVRFELGLLADLGFGLDLSRCAATGALDDLIFVSPRTGRAVSAAAGEPYRDRLLVLPPFLLSSQGGVAPGDLAAGFALTGHFLQRFIFSPLNKPLPPARTRLVERLAEIGRLSLDMPA